MDSRSTEAGKDEQETMSLSPYVPIVGLFALAAAFALFSVAAAPFVGPQRYNRAKLDAYECGIEPTPQPSAAAASRSSST